MEQLSKNWIFRYVTGFHYYKLALFCIALYLSYSYFSEWGGAEFISSLSGGSEFLAAFIGGILYAIGFTAPIGAGVFLTLAHSENVILLAIAGGIGALIADYTILKIVRLSFQDEIDFLRERPIIKAITQRFIEHTPERLKQYVLLGLAGFFLASPLPDEVGITLLAGFTNITEKTFAITCFTLNTLGILVFILI